MRSAQFFGIFSLFFKKSWEWNVQIKKLSSFRFTVVDFFNRINLIYGTVRRRKQQKISVSTRHTLKSASLIHYFTAHLKNVNGENVQLIDWLKAHTQAQQTSPNDTLLHANHDYWPRPYHKLCFMDCLSMAVHLQNATCLVTHVSLFRQITDYCTPETCPTMSAGMKYVKEKKHFFCIFFSSRLCTNSMTTDNAGPGRCGSADFFGHMAKQNDSNYSARYTLRSTGVDWRNLQS